VGSARRRGRRLDREMLVVAKGRKRASDCPDGRLAGYPFEAGLTLQVSKVRRVYGAAIGRPCYEAVMRTRASKHE
jgi:hypothetical protein